MQPGPAAGPAQPPPVGREAVTVRGGSAGASRSARHTQALQGHPRGGRRHGTAAAAEDVCRVRYSLPGGPTSFAGAVSVRTLSVAPVLSVGAQDERQKQPREVQCRDTEDYNKARAT